MYYEKPTVSVFCNETTADDNLYPIPPLSYHLPPSFSQDAFPLGEIVMGTESEGFSVDESAPYELGVGENGFVLNTPNRIYPLQAATAEDKLNWIAMFRAAIEKASLSPNGTVYTETYDTDR